MKAKSSSVMVGAPANLIWMTSVWRLFMKVQNCLNSSSPAPPRLNRCSRMLVSTPGASSGHCPHPPAFASTNNYFALQFRAEVIHYLGDCSKDGLQAVCPREEPRARSSLKEESWCLPVYPQFRAWWWDGLKALVLLLELEQRQFLLSHFHHEINDYLNSLERQYWRFEAFNLVYIEFSS